MKIKDLKAHTAAIKNETKTALQTMYDSLNQGQRKKILKVEAVKTLFDRYGVDY